MSDQPVLPADTVAPEKPMWMRCGCDQWGRCLVNCPSAHLPMWDTPLGRKWGLRRPEEGRTSHQHPLHNDGSACAP